MRRTNASACHDPGDRFPIVFISRTPTLEECIETLDALGPDRCSLQTLELAWTIDFLVGGRFIGIAAYMYDSKLPLYLRSLSLFHLALPPTLLFLLYRFGYDRRALIYQTLLTWVVLIVTYVATDPEKNINWVFGPGNKPQQLVAPIALS